MSKRTQIVCIHEGKRGGSIDPIFANAFLKTYNPAWIRPWRTGIVRLVPYGGKTELREAFPKELQSCITAGGNSTLIVLTDIDDDLEDGDQLKKKYRETAQRAGISEDDFEKAVFIFPKDRIENWVEFLSEGKTDENREGPRIKNFSKVRDMARLLADKCKSPGRNSEQFPPSLGIRQLRPTFFHLNDKRRLSGNT
ncbi:MAG: hypothetical protein LBG57_13925 [Treponema sp.]|nr:hypothetical protein [Treponema sp.]